MDRFLKPKEIGAFERMLGRCQGTYQPIDQQDPDPHTRTGVWEQFVRVT